MESYTGFEPRLGEIRALRTFRVGPAGVLYPLFSDLAWTAGTNTAICRQTGDTSGSHRSPVPGCTCGFYAYGSERAAAEYPQGRHVLAVVACWGRAIAGTRGVRAQHCRVEALWLSRAVPADLVAALRCRYPSVALYRDKATMAAEHPLTVLDCYERSWRRAPRRRLAGAGAVAAAVAVAVATLPAGLWGGVADARVAWSVSIGLVGVAGLATVRRVATDVAVRRRRLLFLAAALWTAAPFAGPAGTWLLRLPLLLLAVLILAQRQQLRREAGRFPAAIE